MVVLLWSLSLPAPAIGKGRAGVAPVVQQEFHHLDVVLPTGLEERGDTGLCLAVLVSSVLQEEVGHLGVSLPACHEEWCLPIVVWCLHICSSLEQHPGYSDVTLPWEEKKFFIHMHDQIKKCITKYMYLD